MEEAEMVAAFLVDLLLYILFFAFQAILPILQMPVVWRWLLIFPN